MDELKAENETLRVSSENADSSSAENEALKSRLAELTEKNRHTEELLEKLRTDHENLVSKSGQDELLLAQIDKLQGTVDTYEKTFDEYANQRNAEVKDLNDELSALRKKYAQRTDERDCKRRSDDIMSEILAPCGAMESLTAAVNAGADAVYLGEEYFSARKNADNFTAEQLCDAVRFCHYSGVKVYVTLNTLVFDREIPLLAKVIENCAKADVDAFIVQDMGVARLSRQIVPELPLHASTQMTVNSPEGAIMAKELGFTRVVLGRELSFAQIKAITESCDIETELFVHGALCVCISGQCYMSSVLGGRSGNRGLCAQPCRLDFTSGDRHNVLSLKDLSLTEKLPELAKAGITSFKIEGRMKTALYVATVARTYRKAIDDYMESPELYRSNMEYYKSEIAKCTYRQFTTGFYFGKTDQDSQIYDNNTYIKNCTYIGNVQEVTEDGLVAFEQKNKFSVGEEIECMNFDGTNTVCRVEEIYNDRMEPMESAPHPKMQLYVKLDRPVSAGMILRRQELSE